MLLDRGGDLVEGPAASSPLTMSGSSSPDVNAAVVLDPRVGINVRLGSDPATLPPAMRAQAEPHIARAPNNPNLLLATFQEGRFTTSGAVDCGFSVSHNGGSSWTRALIPGLTMTSGGPYFRATDPVAGADASGNLYLCTLAATDANFVSGVVLVSRSTDGGATFAAPRVAYRPPNNTRFPDKNWMAINTFPGTPTFGRIVVTFTLFTDTSIEGAPIVQTHSDNGGLTWSPAAYIHPASTNAQGSQPVFLPDGRLAIVYWNFGSPGSPGERLEVVVSNTAGTVFSAPRRIANAVEYIPPQIRSGTFLPAATVDRTNGNLYVVYQTISGIPRIFFTKSTDAGTTWTAPVHISNNTGNTPVFNPAIATSPDGRTLTVSFYDGRANPRPGHHGGYVYGPLHQWRSHLAAEHPTHFCFVDAHRSRLLHPPDICWATISGSRNQRAEMCRLCRSGSIPEREIRIHSLCELRPAPPTTKWRPRTTMVMAKPTLLFFSMAFGTSLRVPTDSFEPCALGHSVICHVREISTVMAKPTSLSSVPPPAPGITFRAATDTVLPCSSERTETFRFWRILTATANPIWQSIVREMRLGIICPAGVAHIARCTLD